MSELIADLDYTMWTMYLQECQVLGVKPSLSDYSVFLQEAEADRKENYEA